MSSNEATPEKTSAAIQTDAVDAEFVESGASTLDDAVSRAREQILDLLQTGQDTVNKSYGFVVDRIENLDLQDLPGYDKLSNIETPKLSTDSINDTISGTISTVTDKLPTDSINETIGGYVSKADELFQTRREQVTEQVNKVLADRKN